MRRLVLTLAVATAGVTATNAQSPVRGVAPADQPKYSDVDGVECVVRGVTTRVPIGLVNDDYCDCDDGKDEPGTAACSHLSESVFYCENGGYFSKHIHTSLLNDGVCDCCDGSDENVAQCPDTCAEEAVEYRKRAEARLAEVEGGFKQRQQDLSNIVAAHFLSAKEKDAQTEKALESLALLKERVEVHKTREERRENKMRLEAARKEQAEAQEAANAGGEDPVEDADGECSVDGDTCGDPGNQVPDFTEVVSDSTVDNAASPNAEHVDDADAAKKDEAAADDSDNHMRATTMIQLSDGTKVSLADYLRMDHSKLTQRNPPKTADQMRREGLLGPLLNGDEEDRKRMAMYALRTIGVIGSPVRLVIEAVIFFPRLLWNVINSSTTLSPYVEKLPALPQVVQSPTFRRLAGGQIYRWYKNLAWGGQIVWDAPVTAYQYLFPKLDPSLTLPEAESLRNALKEIDADMEKLRKERDAQKADLAFDYGPEHAFYLLKERCIEKKVEKYTYKLCPFQDVKQDYTSLGKWEGWGDISGQTTKDFSVMLFSKGARCWNGPERSVKVTLACGATDEIVSVDEPSTCVYEMRARSYVMCTVDELAKARAELAFWSK